MCYTLCKVQCEWVNKDIMKMSLSILLDTYVLWFYSSKATWICNNCKIIHHYNTYENMLPWHLFTGISSILDIENYLQSFLAHYKILSPKQIFLIFFPLSQSLFEDISENKYYVIHKKFLPSRHSVSSFF